MNNICIPQNPRNLFVTFVEFKWLLLAAVKYPPSESFSRAEEVKKKHNCVTTTNGQPLGLWGSCLIILQMFGSLRPSWLQSGFPKRPHESEKCKSQSVSVSATQKPERVCACIHGCLRADLLQDEIGDRSIGVDDDGRHFVIADLLQQRCRVQVVIQHSDWQRLPGDEKAADQFLQSQQAWGRVRAERSCISMSASEDTAHSLWNRAEGTVKYLDFSLNGNIFGVILPKMKQWFAQIWEEK